MHPEKLVAELKFTQEYFNRSSKCLTEEDANFAPAEGIFTTAQQIAHVAQTIEWFHEGAFGKGFDMNFPEHEKEVRKVRSLADARAWLDRAFARIIATIGGKTQKDMETPMPPGPIMGGAPRAVIVGGIADHTAHHRGALTVYARLRGKTPAMPYM